MDMDDEPLAWDDMLVSPDVAEVVPVSWVRRRKAVLPAADAAEEELAAGCAADPPAPAPEEVGLVGVGMVCGTEGGGGLTASYAGMSGPRVVASGGVCGGGGRRMCREGRCGIGMRLVYVCVGVTAR